MKVRKEIVVAAIRNGRIVTKAYVYRAIGLTMVGVVTQSPALYLVQRVPIVDNTVSENPADAQCVGVFWASGERV